MLDATFICECHKYARSACVGLRFYREIDGKKYCVLHCPVQDKVADFNVEFQRKLSSFDYDFRGVYFPAEINFARMPFATEAVFNSAIFSSGVSFNSANFSAAIYFNSTVFNSVADFSGVTFNGLAFFSDAEFRTEVNFIAATFNGDAILQNTTFGGIARFPSSKFIALLDFSGATFEDDADYIDATFASKTYFIGTVFNACANFSGAEFSAAVDFREATFCAKSSFDRAIVESYMRFTGTAKSSVFTKKSQLSFELAHFADPEQVVFYTVRLHPHWFVNADPRKFEFTNIDWGKISIRDELHAIEHIENRHRLFSIACRQLATNAEDNNRYREAARFRYASMDAQRLERWRGWNIFTLDWWYWLVSGYGERIPRAAICLLVLLLGFSFLFTKVGFETKTSPEVSPIMQEMMPTPPQPKDLPLPSFRDGLTYAMSAALFQRPEPKAYTFWAKTCVSLEMIFVPLQAALLALAIRRRFMR